MVEKGALGAYNLIEQMLTCKWTQQEFTLYTNKNEVAIEFSRRREDERFISRTFVILIVLDYKRTRQSRRQSVVRIQSFFSEVVCKENSRGLKITVVKIKFGQHNAIP